MKRVRRKLNLPNHRGMNNNHHRLTDDDIEGIRDMRRKTGLSLRALGKMFGVSHRCIHAIVRKESWSHLP